MALCYMEGAGLLGVWRSDYVAEQTFNPLKCSGIGWLHLKVINAIQV